MEGSYMITKVEIYLDDDIPEYMAGLIRCGTVNSYDQNDIKHDHQELIDNTEYQNEKEVIEDIAKRLSISTDIINIVA